MSTIVQPHSPILIVDDEMSALRVCEIALRSGGIGNTVLMQESREVLPYLAEHDVELLLLDLNMPGMSGLEVLEGINETYPHLPVVVVTGANEVDQAVQCMKAGAFDYLVKPVEQNRLISSVVRAMELRELRRENRSLRERLYTGELCHPEAFAEIITQHPRMRALFQYVEAIARSTKPVLVTGETGTGKELFARAVHTLSGCKGRFVGVNVAGLDDSMFSDTLFGHVKGAFTGADSDRPGMIEQAVGGTLFLDEIGDLSAVSQVKLLRLLQELEYLPLGADFARRSNARIVVATCRSVCDLETGEGFRRDLFYRLQTHHIHILPLRERVEDIPLLLDHFLDRAAKALVKRKPTPPKELTPLLQAYPFPGNVRELESLVFDGVSRHVSGILSMDAFRDRIGRPTLSADLGNEDSAQEGNPFASLKNLPTIKVATDMLIAEALERTSGNQGMAARLLGIDRTSLNKRLRRPQD